MHHTLPDLLLEGRTEPMGALARDGGVNFTVFSQHAESLMLCVFDSTGARELKRYRLHGPHDGLWHGFLPGVGPGLVYGLRAKGPYAPERGHRFNHHKLLLDPCAREIVGHFRWAPEHYGFELGHPEGARSFDRRDNALLALKARVPPPPQPAPGLASAPRVAPADMVLYELHVKGFTQQHPDIPEALRGTYAGLAQPAAVAHFKRLGVTTLSLLPVHYHLDEAALVARGQVNYWGYNTIGFFAPDPRLAQQRDDPTAVNDEFRQMVATLHGHGLEVVLDVVYNHTAEAGETGPTLSFRGLDHANWYRLQHDDHSRCENLTGCGNTVNVSHPRVTQFVMDSLRYWVEEMGVDGFRFDLAPVLGRLRHGFDPHASFFTALRQDPVLSRVHLIAEPWDAGPGGYQVGRFPGRWLEWNDRFRDTMRRYWIGRTGAAGQAGVGRGEFARRFTASSDLFHHGQRRPSTSINFIAVHDGFTLADVVSYASKHNLANGEHNHDGRSDEPCHPFGPEGESHDAGVRALRARVKRAMLTTLLLAQGTPMLYAGDELGHSQQGNNNAYCQDNATAWLDWAQADQGLADFVARLIALRAAEPALRYDHWFAAKGAHASVQAGGPAGERVLDWFAPGGLEMQVNDWHDGQQQALACRINGLADQPALLLLFNPEATALPFVLPAAPAPWQLLLDSSGDLDHATAPVAAASPLRVPPHALLLLRQAAAASVAQAATGSATVVGTTPDTAPAGSLAVTPALVPPSPSPAKPTT